MLKKNNKGMTLVEIVIVLLIASIAMTITGGILVNSLGYFDDNTKASIDKQSVDGILDYIDGEIKYATDVVVAKDKPKNKDNWHCLYVQPSVETNNQNILYRDSDDSPVFSEDYYTKRNLVIEVRGFTVNEHRLDLTLKYKDKNNKEVYKTSKTFELINLNIDTENANNKNLFSNISESTEINSGNKLWYRKGTSVTPSDTDDDNSGGDDEIPDTGTVADQIKCLNNYNNRGEFSTAQKHYFLYDFVYYDNYWWQLVNGDENFTNDKNKPILVSRKWKKIDKYYDYRSAYTVGDVIYYKKTKQYYRCIQDLINTGATTADKDSYAPDEPYNGIHKWVPLGSTLSAIDDRHDYTKCDEDLANKRLRTVLNKMDSLTKEQINAIPMYNATENYTIGSWIYKDIDGIKQYYLKIADGTGEPGSSASSGWQIISRDWNVKSAYTAGDQVYVTNGGTMNAVLYNKLINFEIDFFTNKFQEEITGASGWPETYTYDLYNTNNNKYYTRINAY